MAQQQITVSRPIPQQPRKHSPWPGRFLFGLGLLVVATILASVIFAVVTNVSSPAPAQPIVVQTNPVVVPAPAVDVPNPLAQDVAPIDLGIPEIEVPWVSMGMTKIGQKVAQFPEDRIFYISGPKIWENLKTPSDGLAVYWEDRGAYSGFFRGHGLGDKTAVFLGTEYYDNISYFMGGGHGDGTAFFVRGHNGYGTELYWFTPDRGERWFKPANVYPGESMTPPETPAAFIEGNTLVLWMFLQPKPNIEELWQAEIPLAKLEELSR